MGHLHQLVFERLKWHYKEVSKKYDLNFKKLESFYSGRRLRHCQKMCSLRGLGLGVFFDFGCIFMLL